MGYPKARHGRAEHAGSKLFGGKTMTSRSSPVSGHGTGGGVKFGMADHHRANMGGDGHRVGLPCATGADCFSGTKKQGDFRVNPGGGHFVGKK